MAQVDEHIAQVKKNLNFLNNISQIPESLDWQVTVCFYSALHLINAHLASNGLQYRKHSDVDNAINPFNKIKLCALPQEVYTAYSSLYKLSRRSRYLVDLKDNNINSNQGCLIYEKHLGRALKHLDTILIHFVDKFNLKLKVFERTLPLEVQKHRFTYFKNVADKNTVVQP